MIHEVARSYVGTPFRHMGRLPGIGLDCVGVVLCAAWACGIDVPDVRDYGRVPSPDFVLGSAGGRAARVTGAWEPGDVLCLQFRPEWPMHFAILGTDWLIQAMEAAGGVVETRLTRSTRGRIHSAWRLHGTARG